MLSETIYGCALDGKSVEKERIASRAIFYHENKVLMIYCKFYDDYSFPGGGVERNETIEDCLKRESYEEVGARNVTVQSRFACITEYRKSIRNKENEIFKQISYYSLCEAKRFGRNHLEKYEVQLGYFPIWIEPEKALEHNVALKLQRKNQSTALEREIRVLQHFIEEIER